MVDVRRRGNALSAGLSPRAVLGMPRCRKECLMEKRIYRTRIRGGFMKMRLTQPVAAQSAWLIAGRSAAGAVLLAITVSACSGGSSSVPSIFTPTPQASGQSSSDPGTRTPSPTGQVSRTSGGSRRASQPPAARQRRARRTRRLRRTRQARPRRSRRTVLRPPRRTATHLPRRTPRPRRDTAAPTHTSAPATPAFPTAAPETGGGGTAGLQDGLLFGTGGAAVLAGLGAFALRRRLARKFGASEPATPDPADREPADR